MVNKVDEVEPIPEPVEEEKPVRVLTLREFRTIEFYISLGKSEEETMKMYEESALREQAEFLKNYAKTTLA